MPGAFGTASEAELLAAAKAEPGTDGIDLVATVTCAEPYTVGTGPFRVVAYDYGIKATMLRHLGELATVEVVPASTPRERGARPQARRRVPLERPRRPGDGRVRDRANIGQLLGEVPVFGICLGHQLLGVDARRPHVQAAVRASRRQPSGAPPRDRPDRDHEPEPQLRRRRRRPRRRRRDAREPERRRRRGHPLPRRARVQRAVPPRGRPRSARRALSVRRVPSD